MTNTILYIATSLDGYIANRDGGIDWLSTIDESDDDCGYPNFLIQQYPSGLLQVHYRRQ